MLKILHTADVHLDARFSILGEKAKEQREQLKKTFSRVIELLIKKKVNLFLIAGDLFDSNYPSQQSIDFVKKQFKLLNENKIPICLLPGTHDCLNADNVYLREKFNNEFPNLHIFDQSNGSSKEYLNLDVTVSGKPLTSNKSKESPLKGDWGKIRTNWHIIMAHGSLQIPGKSTKDDWPITFEEIANSKADYLALGHWHSLSDYSFGGVNAWYSGAPEIIDIDQKKAGYVLFVCFDKTKQPKVDPVRVSERETDELEIDTGEYKEINQIKDQILKNSHKNLIRTVRLKGITPLDLLIETKELEEELGDNFFRLKIINQSKPKIDITEKNYPEELITGQFIRLMRKKIKEAKTEEERKIAEEVLQIGINELQGKKIID